MLSVDIMSLLNLGEGILKIVLVSLELFRF